MPLLEAEEAEESEESSSTVRHAKAAAEAAGLNLATLKLTIDVEAPIFRLEAWKDGAALEIHLGHFSGNSTQKNNFSDAEVDSDLRESEVVDLKNFALICELRDTRIKLMDDEDHDRFAYEPSKIVVIAARKFPAGGEIHAEFSRMRCHIDPGLMRLFGHLQVGLDFALAPLSQMSRQVEGSPKMMRSVSLRRSASKQGYPWKFDLRTGSFDLIWDPMGAGGYHDASVKGHIAGVNVKVNVDEEGQMIVVGKAQDAAMKCGERPLLSV